MTTRFTFSLVLLIPLAFSGAAFAEDPPTADIKPGDAASDNGEFAELVKQLDAKKKDDRDAASAKLKEAGVAAIPAITDGAIHGKRETTIRAIDILKAHLQGADPAAHKAAQDAFARIAQSKAPVAVKRAKEVLQGVIQNQQGPNGQIGGIGGPNIGGFGGAGGFGGGVGGFGQFGGAGGAGTGEGHDFHIHLFDNNVKPPKKYTMKGKGKSRDIEAEEKGRKVKIKIDEQGGIQMEITEPKDGQDTTRKVEAKDAADLKEKDAEAHKDFDNYSKPPKGFGVGPIPGGGAGGFGGGFGGAVPPGLIPALPGFPGGNFGLPGAFPQAPALPGDGLEPAAQREALDKHLKELEGQIETLRKSSDIPRQSKVAQIEALQQTIRTAHAKIKELERTPAKKVEKE